MLRTELDRGNDLFHSGKYIQANQVFQSVFAEARDARVWDLAARAGGNSGGCQFALHQYQAALPAFLEARGLARRAGDSNEVAILDANIASLYSEMGNPDTAASWMQGVRERLAGEDRKRYLPQILIQLALLRARQGRMPEALQLFRQGIDGADRAGNLDLYSLAWNRLGTEYLGQRNLAAAEGAFLEAYRVRKLNHLPLESCYRNLGRLRLEQGDLVSASNLLDRCVELSTTPQGAIPAWDVYHSRGRVRMAQGRLREAVSDLRIALHLARAWRWSTPANEAGRVGAGEMLDQVYAAFIEAGNLLYLETHDASLMRETFEAEEENRAAGLRATVAGPAAAPSLSPEYWEALLRLQRAEVQALRSPAEAAKQEVTEARALLSRLDASQFRRLPGEQHTEGLTGRVRKSLDAASALFSFHLGAAHSWLWAVDRSSIKLYALPGQDRIREQAAAATNAIRDDSPDAARAGQVLFRSLFGSLGPEFRKKKRWLLALDQGPDMFAIPFAALAVETKGPRVTFLAERYNTVLIPSAAFWAGAAQQRSLGASPLFVGIGDAIYNAADPRAVRTGVRSGSTAASAALPRLVASGAELDACARAWNGNEVLLKGAQASRGNLETQIGRNPTVLHFATHFLPSSSGMATSLIALSLNDRGETQLLAPEEIAHWKVNTNLVVLSGCSSAAGAVLPGAGLLGLTRAWLTAGARCVIGSRWNTPDDTGPLFGTLYRKLQEQSQSEPAEALRAAQVEMIREGDWRARPRYWGAYLAVGGE